jgi:cell division protein FtsN
MPKPSPARQRGGFILGLIIGLLLGLALALGVALYVTKVPIPFVDKLPQRSAEQDAAEAERNKNWDPNAPLNGNRSAKPASAAGPATATPALPKPTDRAVVVAPGDRATAVPSTKPGASAPGRDPAAILAGQKPGPATSSGPAAEAFVYYVQAGAYGRPEDAEQQRAKLAMAGFESKVTERDQSGRPVYRVRLGPFDKRSEAESTQDRLGSNGVEAALVRVQK